MPKPYIATQKITIGTALAFVPGDVVPDDTVDIHGLAESVAREGTKSADTAAKQAAEPGGLATGISDQL